MSDPFPDEDKLTKNKGKLPEEVDGQIQLVYPENRYVEGNSPYTMYIPSIEVMFKLMRSCICVKEP